MHRGVGVLCRFRHVSVCVLLFSGVAAIAAAQPPASASPAAPGQPAAPPPLWTGSAGAGFSMNRGNTDTTNVNLSFEATRDPKTHSVWKFKALYLRGQTDGRATVDRFLAEARNERDLSARVYAFGALQFLEDRFKKIDYLWAPAGGIGYRVLAAPTTTLNVDGGVGAKIERDTDLDRRTDPVVALSDTFEHKLSKTSSITQGYSALWKATDFGDVIETFTAGVAASLTTRTQMKLEFLDSYVSRPPTIEVKQNDVALLATFVYKF